MKAPRFAYVSLLTLLIAVAFFLLPQTRQQESKLTACTQVTAPQIDCPNKASVISKTNLNSLDIFLR